MKYAHTADQQDVRRRLLKDIWARNLFPEMKLQEVLGLYEKFRDDLRLVKEQQQVLFARRESIGLVPQLCDIEAEISYLRIREYRPDTVVEISPASGWSTSWILHALQNNGLGTLHSYDLVEDSTRVIPHHLAEGRWQFYKGDIKENIGLLPVEAEYLFIDSDHSAEFAYWYIAHLFPLFGKGKTKVSVHDILKWPHEPGWGEESPVLCSWLAENRKDCMTACRIMRGKGYDAIVQKRKMLGLDSVIQTADYNSMIFFEL